MEPSTVQQDASLVYKARFGPQGHSNIDINKVETKNIPIMTCWLAVFLSGLLRCLHLSKSGGITGQKGAEVMVANLSYSSRKGDKRPNYVFLENVDRLLGSPAKQRGRDLLLFSHLF